MADQVFDVAIIGGGPAGLSCAIYTARAKLSTVVLDRAPGAGSLACATKIANYPGIRGEVAGCELLDIMRDQAVGFGARYERAAVTAADLTSEPKTIYTTNGGQQARAVVIATGARGRAERIDGEEEFLGRGVSYCATCDAAFYQDRIAAVVGSDEAAAEEALFLARFAREVHIVCPRSALAAPVHLLREIDAAPNVSLLTGTAALEIVGHDAVNGLVVKQRSQPKTTIPVDGVFMLLSGAAPVTDFLGGALKLSANGCVIVDCNFATDIPGVYAVGDVTCLHPKQAVIAAAEGVIAALEIDRYIGGRDRARVDYS